MALLLFLTVVGLTSVIEVQECFLKFGISVRPLAHILDTNKKGKEELRLGENRRGGWFCDITLESGEMATDTWTQKHEYNDDKKAIQDSKPYCELKSKLLLTF